MARTQNKLQINNFIGGLVTDYQELNHPVNTTVDEDNVDITRKGSRRRRRGIEFESGYTSAALTLGVNQSEAWFQTYTWEAVGNDGDLNFLIVQAGKTLTFYNKSTVPLSANALPFTIDLDTYMAPDVTTTGDYGIQVASGKGALFVVGERITPFYVEYDPGTNDITITSITLQIRDLDFLDNTDPSLEEATISNERLYDLHNQGWDTDNIKCYDIETETIGGYTNVLDFHVLTQGTYPPKTKHWWLGKRLGDGGVEVYDPSGEYRMQYGGNALAANGHFIIDPFNKDRSTVSGIPGLANEVEVRRPVSVAFYAGRFFCALDNRVYFSWVLEDNLNLAGNCYQEADPTSEEISELIATDGGSILIPDAGEIIGMIEYQSSLLCVANNGVWAIGGIAVGEGFDATQFRVHKISDKGCSNVRTFFKIDGQPTWWGSDGIYLMTASADRQGYQVSNILDKIVSESGAIGNRTFYDETIPAYAKSTAAGCYNKIQRKVVWIFDGGGADSGSTGRNRFLCDRVLQFDMNYGAFYPYTISPLIADSPYVVDVFPMKPSGKQITTEVVVDNLGATVTAADTSDVTVNILTNALSVTSLGSGVKYLTLYPGVVDES